MVVDYKNNLENFEKELLVSRNPLENKHETQAITVCHKIHEMHCKMQLLTKIIYGNIGEKLV